MNRAARWRLDLFWLLTRTEFRLRDQGTALGFLWTLARPAVQFAVLYAVFSAWMGPRVESWAAYLLIGVVQWDFFAGATGHGLTSLRRKAGLVRQIAFPRAAVVLASVASVLLSHLIEWALLLAILPALGAAPRASWLALPALVALEAALAMGAALVLAPLAAPVRDLEQAWSLALYALFFATPVFYDAAALGPAGRTLVALNPLAAILDATRSCLLGGAPPGAAPAAGAAAACLAAAVLGLALFPRLARGVEEWL